MQSSIDLIARAREGDQDAFRLIFERYSRPVISFIYDQVGDRELAEELAQETFVRAYRALDRLHEETKLSTWLFGIAKNVARESIRARVRQASREIAVDDWSYQPAGGGFIDPSYLELNVSKATEELVNITMPRPVFEKLNAKMRQILVRAARTRARIAEDQEEIDLLREETRGLLNQLRAS